MNLASQFPYSVVLVAVLIAAASDIRAFKIYNALTLPLLASGLLYHGIVGGASALAASALGALLGLGLLFLVFLMGGMGGGDVKLMAGFGAILGLGRIWQAALLTAILGALFAMAYLLVRKIRGKSTNHDKATTPEAIPYAPAISLGALLSFAAG